MPEETMSEDIARFYAILGTVSDKIAERMSIIERSTEALEKQFANIVVGFAEQAVLIEALISQLSFSTDEERKAFDERKNAKRKEMLSVLREGGMAFADDDPEIAEALEQLLSDAEGRTSGAE